jgi:hypothetical protein
MYPFDQQPGDISIFDISHALSNICRFTGHCSDFYSVAQHSLIVSLNVSEENALWGLLHDASEAYLCDVSRPIKHDISFAKYREIERKLQAVIVGKYGLSVEQPDEVTRVDNALLIAEAQDLGLFSSEWSGIVDRLPVCICPLLPKDIETKFLDRFNELRGR